MKVTHLSYADIHGGAFVAAYRVHNALLDVGIESDMWVDNPRSDDRRVMGPMTKGKVMLASVRKHVVKPFVKTLRTGNSIIHSPAILPSYWVNLINASDVDIVNLHWVQSEMLSIEDIGRIKKPIVWTLHDMWPFCGAEHYTEDCRWREGYFRDNRPTYESGFDLNRWAWKRKQRHWKRPMSIIAPSRWLADCARQSALMGDWPIDLVPYPIDIDRWSPLEKKLARDLLGLPKDVPLLLFGATGGGRDPRKGFDLLIKALDELDEQIPDLELVVLGQMEPEAKPEVKCPIHYMGHLYDNLSLRVLFSAADVFALPSRQDNLPLTCMESLSCGTPVVAFNESGPPSMVQHKKTGYLADAFNASDFAMGIRYLLNDTINERAGKLARAYAENHFAPNIIAAQYLDIYKRTIR